MAHRSSAARLFALFCIVAVAGAVPATGGARGSGLDRIGKLPIPKGIGTASLSFLGIDTPNRRLYVDFSGVNNDLLTEYDLSHRIPTIARAVPFDSSSVNTSPYAFAFDSQDHVAFSIVHSASGAPDIRTFDLRTLAFTGAAWNVKTKLPGFDSMGLAYSARDRRLYVAGFFAGGVGLGLGSYADPVPTIPSGIAAFDTRGNLLWWKVIPQCQMLGGHFDWGSSIFASTRLDALYVFCVRPSFGTGIEAEYPGESGLVRLWITPQGTQSDASSYRVEFFPVAGHFVSGEGLSVFAGFDPVAERVYVVNQSSTTPGMWAFDGSLPAWVGFMGTDSNSNNGIGIDEATGHVFVEAGDDTPNENVIVTAGRDTPVPQGVKFLYDLATTGFIWMVDSPTHRLFLPMNSGDINVLEDNTASYGEQRPIDYDSVTADVPEGPNTTSTFAGDASGFGARALLVGGYGGIVDPVNQVQGNRSNAIGGFSPGDRSVTAASVPSLDLRDSGAAASAQAVAPDSLTQNDYTTQQTAIRTDGNQVKAGTGDQAASMLDWKWPAAACLDAADEKKDESGNGPGGTSSVSCDLAKALDQASAQYDGFAINGVTIGSTSFAATSQREAKAGIVTEATAVVRDVHVLVDGGGSLVIQRVEATASTVAHGRSGTAHSTWVPLIEGAVLRDTNGKVLFSCDQCNPTQLAQEVNDSALAVKMRILLPTALLQRTPHGAYASVGKTTPDYWSGLTMNDDNSHAVPAMQIELYNDYGQKSRLVLQLAAIQASSIYGISVLPSYQPPPAGGSIGSILPPIAHGTNGTSTIVDGKYVNGGVGGSTVKRFVLGVGALIRSPKDAVLFALVCLLFGGAAAVVRRRQLLASSLEESSR